MMCLRLTFNENNFISFKINHSKFVSSDSVKLNVYKQMEGSAR